MHIFATHFLTNICIDKLNIDRLLGVQNWWGITFNFYTLLDSHFADKYLGSPLVKIVSNLFICIFLSFGYHLYFLWSSYTIDKT